MKYKGVIPEGYELVLGRSGKYLRKLPGSRPVNKVLTRNSMYAGRVNQVAATIKDGLAAERKNLYDGGMYRRLTSLLLRAVDLDQKWWRMDWLCGFEVNAMHALDTMIFFKSSYQFKRNILSVELTEVFLYEVTRRKKKEFDAMQLKAVLLFIDEDKGQYTRYESEPAVAGVRTNKMQLEIKLIKKPKQPFVIFIHGAGMINNKVIESVDATGMKVIASGVEYRRLGNA